MLSSRLIKYGIRDILKRSKRFGGSVSHWSVFPMGQADPIIGLNEAFAKDDFPLKVNVGVGAYRGDDGKPYVLPCVREAERIIQSKEYDMEYANIAGDEEFVNVALKFALGEDSVPLKEGRVAGVQSLSGTGGLRVFGELMAKFGHKEIYVPDPTWGNHIPIFTNAGLKVKKYRYYDNSGSALDFEGFLQDMAQMPPGSIILLHACAHNPTGMDPTPDQWAQISDLVKLNQLLPFFDCAYQGFASGDPHKDANALRMFIREGHHIALVQSFSKNFGLYGQRIGALSVVAPNPQLANNVLSQLKIVIRPMYSNPPRHGARIVTTILSHTPLANDFSQQCKLMATRINTMRHLLKHNLEQAGSTRNWDHITDQIGMFAYSGLTKHQVQTLRDQHHIYCTLDGRISMAVSLLFFSIILPNTFLFS